MRLDVVHPQGWLAAFVDHYWRVDATPDEYPFSREVLLPDGGVTVLFNLGDAQYLVEGADERRFERSWFSGERTRPITLGSPGTTHLVGVRFRPGGAYPFFSTPVHEITDSVVDLDLAWAAGAERTRERLAATSTMPETVAVLEAALASQSRLRSPDRTVFGAVSALRRISDDGLTVGSLAAGLGVGERTLRRRFHDRVGLGPKMLQRLFRFQQVLRLEAESDTCDWSDMACACGYYDQPHLIGEFREFSGVTPTRYRELRGVLPGYLPAEVRDGPLDPERAERWETEILAGRDPLDLSLGR